MLTPRENYFRAVRYEHPEWVPVFGEDMNVFSAFIWSPDPETHVDWLGTTWVNDGTGSMPDFTKPAMTSVTQWRERVKWPDLSQIDWEAKAAEFFEKRYDPDKVTIAMANTHGPFLIPINMMGWENGLCDLMDETEEFLAFSTRLTDLMIEYIGYVGKYIHPDVIFSGDDFAAKDGPFISKDVWEAVFKENLTRICDAIHEQGALAEFHCCGNCQYLIAEEIACGYDICQLPVPNEELKADKARFGKRMVITGGWDRHGAAGLPGASEEVVRASVREAIDTFGKEGGLIFWDGGIIMNNDDSRQKMQWVIDELHTYGKAVYAEDFARYNSVATCANE